MIKNRLKIIKKLPGILQLRRWYNHYRSDVVLVSFPKSGRTWLRVLIGRALQQHYSANEEIIMKTSVICELDSRIPILSVSHDDFAQNKTPEEISSNKNKYKNKSVIFLVRDPRDVIVSLYFHKSFRRGESKRYNGSISQFIRLKMGGMESMIKFYNVWAENHLLPEKFLLVRYEDMIQDSKKELERVFNFMGINWLSGETLNNAVQYGSFDNLQSIEASNKLSTTSLQTNNVDNHESFKVRKGKVGGYKDYLSAEDIDYIEELISKQLSDYFSFYK
jgi:Sulfotransferase domain